MRRLEGGPPPETWNEGEVQERPRRRYGTRGTVMVREGETGEDRNCWPENEVAARWGGRRREAGMGCRAAAGVVHGR